ncbi:MAG TPA: arylesterase [Gemmatimonadaceae bacterium]|nr:arylesterase [Gemmatimonadaceae bacterium]
MRFRAFTWTLGGLLALAACGSGSARGAAATVKDSTGTGGPAAAGPSAPRAASRESHTVLFVGTSLTAGLGLDPDSAYPALVQRKIDSAGLPFRVVNAGVSGETSAGALRRMDWLLRQPFDVMVLETGANDGLRGTPVSETRANIQAIIDTVRRARPGAHIVLVQMEALPNLGVRYTRAFHATYPLIARERRVTLLPFLLNGVAGHASLNQSDGMHPNDDGEKIVADNVWRGLRPVLDSVASGGAPARPR